VSTATLGLTIDSSPAVKAAVDLDRLVGSANAAEVASAKLTAASKGTTDTLVLLDSAASPMSRTMVELDKRTTSAASAHAGYSTQAMAAFHATRSMAEGLLYGISPMQALALQVNHLTYAASGPSGLTGAFKEVGSMVSGLLTPTRLLGVGIVAAGAAAYLANSAWKTSALELDNVAKSAGLTITQMRALDRDASGNGISDFSTSAQKFASSIYDARNGMGSLADLLHVNGQRASTFEGTLESVSRILQRSSSDQQRLQLLQQAGLPATMEWVRWLSQGPDAIQKAVSASSDLGNKEQELIDKARDFDRAWDRAWTSFKGYAVDATVGTKAALKELSDAARNIPESAALGIPPVADVAGGRPRVTIDVTKGGNVPLPQVRPSNLPQATDPNLIRASLQALQSYYGILGQTLTVDQQIAQFENQIRMYRLDPKARQLSNDEYNNLTRLARERALGIDQIKASRNAYDVETASIGMNVGQAAAYAAVQSKINEYKRNGVPLTEDNISAIQREAGAMGVAAQRVDDMRFGFDTFSGTLRDIGANIRQTGLSWQTFENAGVNALGKISDRLMDMASRSLWNAAFPTGGGGMFSFLGGIFGGGGGVLPGGSPLGMGGIGHNAAGTDNWSGGPTWVGEKGPEIVNLPPGARVTPNNKVAAMMGAGGGTFAPVINITNAPTFNNADPGVEARLRQQIAQSAADTQQKTVAAVQKLSQNSPGNYLPPKR
jgi:hypothetical protein